MRRVRPTVAGLAVLVGALGCFIPVPVYERRGEDRFEAEHRDPQSWSLRRSRRRRAGAGSMGTTGTATATSIEDRESCLLSYPSSSSPAARPQLKAGDARRSLPRAGFMATGFAARPSTSPNCAPLESHLWRSLDFSRSERLRNWSTHALHLSHSSRYRSRPIQSISSRWWRICLQASATRTR